MPRAPVLAALLLAAAPAPAQEDLPIRLAALEKLQERTVYGHRNLISLEELQGALRSGDARGLVLDLGRLETLLDGSPVDARKIYGVVYAGPYPFEAAETGYAYKRFRVASRISGGRARIPHGYLLAERHNSEGWTDKGTLALRIELREEREGQDRPLGTYDTFVRFDRAGTKLPMLVEGPLVSLVRSDDPTRVVLSFVTDRPVQAAVEVNDRTLAEKEPATRHEIAVDGLQPATEYRYHVRIGERIATHTLRTAPPKGEGTVRFAFCGDSREGVGGGTRALMGVNYEVLHQLVGLAYARGAEFLIMGGDLVNGYTTSPADFRLQLHAWKQAMMGFWRERAVYPAMGNHEALLRNFESGSRYGIGLDRWPYATQSAEALFAEAFVNPRNGPQPSDPRRPTYLENVYSFHYGPVKLICFNNNYWVSYSAPLTGGCPEGYLMEDQLAWIEREVQAGQADPKVRYIVLYAQEPAFPNGGHVGDSMWHGGDNRVRAFTFHPEPKGLVPAAAGMVEVRNRLVRLAGANRKVAAVLGSDEHAYHKVLIDKHVPVGIPGQDDTNGDGKLETAAPLAGLKHATWYLVCGGGGAPYYSEQVTPWNRYWLEKAKEPSRYRYSSQHNILLFEAGADGISVEVLNPHGEVIDRIANLMDVK
jgi:3',5'-cyclic AMP phosphodiesterase CpdA